MKFTELEEQEIIKRSGLVPEFVPAEVLAGVRQRYLEPHRHYHTWDHALNFLAWITKVSEESPLFEGQRHRGLSGKIAALFHDVIYDIHRGAPWNEEQSAILMIEQLGNLEGENEVSKRLILATAKHGKLESSDVNNETALFLDCDLISFADQLWETILWTDQNIVKEYLQKYSYEDVRAGRREFLQGLLAKKSIFLSEYFKARFEQQARSNIQRLLAEVYC